MLIPLKDHNIQKHFDFLPLMAEYKGWNDGSDQKISGVSKMLLTRLTLILMINNCPIFFVIAVLFDAGKIDSRVSNVFPAMLVLEVYSVQYPVSISGSNSLPRHGNLSCLGHGLRNVFRSVDGIFDQSFKKCHLHRLCNGVRNCQLDHVVSSALQSDDIVVNPKIQLGLVPD